MNLHGENKLNNFNPLVSIVIPVYNGANYLREAIDSALAQTYKNIEIIVVNDGSNDNGETEKIALSYGNKIRYFSKENGGTSTALNLGINNMKGEYFSWLSHDDQYYPDKIKMQVNTLADLADKTTIIMSDLDGIDENYNSIYKTNYLTHIKNYPPREYSNIHPIIYNQTHGCTLLISRICFDVVGLFDENERVAQDFEFFYRAFSKFPHKLISKILVTARDSSNRQGIRCKPQADVEYSRLYIKIIENLTEEEIKLLAPTRLDFYIDMRFFFNDAQYSIALKYINNILLSNLQISSYDLMGQRFNGHDLHNYLREYDVDSKQLVLYKQSKDTNTFVYDFEKLNSTKDLLQQKIFIDSDIIHLHLVHNILDISYLPLITKLRPTVITLHDPFYLGGHCIHSFNCNKWQSHCADCPYLDKDFRLFNDISAYNFSLKKTAIQNSQITGIVASKWMKNKVEKSPIWKDKKIYLLPFGINQNLFKPGDSSSIRQNMNIPVNNTVLFFRADTWEYKGFDIILEALHHIENKKNVTIITVGEKGLLDKFKNKFNIIEYNWIKNDEKMIQLYQACDIFLMPSRQETFGLMAVEAMSCGKMVLALEGEGTALPEVIDSPNCGLAVKESDFSRELARLIDNKSEIHNRGNKCLDYARLHYSKEKYIREIINIYNDVIGCHIYDEETTLVLQQLKKYANNDLIKNTMDIKHKKLKKVIRFCVNKTWKLIILLHLKSFITSSQLYSKMADMGLIDKLRNE